MTPPMVSVRWLDSGMHVDKGWTDAGSIRSGSDLSRMEVHTVGLLMDEDDDTVAVALNHDAAHDMWLSVQFIARTNIISMETLTT